MARAYLVRYVVRPIDRVLARVALLGVLGYRRWLSPLKGYRCAAAACDSGLSCSDVAVVSLRDQPLSKALRVIREQLRRCRAAKTRHTQDLLAAADAHLSQYAALATAGAIGCCPFGCDDDKKVKPPIGGNPPALRVAERAPAEPGPTAT